MIILNTAITFTWALPATATVYAASDWDLLVDTPDGLSTYVDNLTEGAYTAPTAETDGSIVYTHTFTQAGLHKMVLSTGTSASYTRVSESLVSVIEPTTAKTISVQY